MAHEGTHCPAAVARLGVTPRAWGGHSERRAGVAGDGPATGCLALGSGDSVPPVPWGPTSTGSCPLGCGVPSCPLGCGTISLSLAKPFLLGAFLPSAGLQATSPTTAARAFHCLHAQLLPVLLVPSLHSPPLLGKGCPEQVNPRPGAPSLSCLCGRSAVVVPQTLCRCVLPPAALLPLPRLQPWEADVFQPSESPIWPLLFTSPCQDPP